MIVNYKIIDLSQFIFNVAKNIGNKNIENSYYVKRYNGRDYFLWQKY